MTRVTIPKILIKMIRAGRSRNVREKHILFHLVINVPLSAFFLFRFSVHLNLYGFNQPSPLKKSLTNIYIYFVFSRSGTTFENTVSESYPRNVSTGKLNLVLIVIVLVAIFTLAIAVVFGILFFRRHQSHKNQGKFFASFPYSLILMFFFLVFFFLMSRISKHELEVIPLSGIVHFLVDVKPLASSQGWFFHQMA